VMSTRHEQLDQLGPDESARFRDKRGGFRVHSHVSSVPLTSPRENRQRPYVSRTTPVQPQK
jgi:hypothetical protein